MVPNTLSDQPFAVRLWLPVVPLACGIGLFIAGVNLEMVRQSILGAGIWAPLAFFRFHFLMRLTPLPTAMISYAMGASGSRFRPFLLGAAAAVLPQTLWVHGGTALTAIDEPGTSPLRWLGVVLSVVAALALSIAIPRLAMKRMEAMTGLSVAGAKESC